MNTLEIKSTLPNNSNWQFIDWQSIEKYVEKLHQRIYHAENLKNHRKVRDLQRLLMNSKASLQLSKRRVTQLNSGKRTSGVASTVKVLAFGLSSPLDEMSRSVGAAALYAFDPSLRE